MEVGREQSCRVTFITPSHTLSLLALIDCAKSLPAPSRRPQQIVDPLHGEVRTVELLFGLPQAIKMLTWLINQELFVLLNRLDLATILPNGRPLPGGYIPLLWCLLLVLNIGRIDVKKLTWWTSTWPIRPGQKKLPKKPLGSGVLKQIGASGWC